jgi:transcriptional regulator with XRE-family HTH domain
MPPEPKRKRSAVSEAVVRLRTALGETQEQFAARMGTSVATIARYETSRTPKRGALDELIKIADENGLASYADVFRKAQAGEIITSVDGELRMLLTAKSQQEAMLVNAVLRVLRNPQLYAKELSNLQKVLSRPVRDIEGLRAKANIAAEVKAAIGRLFMQGRTQDDISERFKLDPGTVAIVGAQALIEKLNREETEDGHFRHGQ